MTEVVQALCVKCKGWHPANCVSDEEAKIIAEDAQHPSDYYLMDGHVNPKTGLACEGVGRTPEQLEDPFDEDHYSTMDDEPPEDEEEGPLDWLGEDEPGRFGYK